MKKKICILICLILTITALGTYAAAWISETVAFNKLSKFDQMVTVMNETVDDVLEHNYALVNYKYLETGYGVSADNMDYMADLIIDGYSAQDVIKCAFFWLDTAEDVSIIKKMCDWKIKNEVTSEEDFWIENAFNEITDYKCGVLTLEDFDVYEEKGISDADIMNANRLCRKGVYTIQEILAKFEKGEAMVDIALEIESKEPITVHTDVVSVYSAAEVQKDHPKADDTELFESRQLAMLKKAPQEAFYDTTDNTTTVIEELEQAVEEISDTILEELKESGYLKAGEEVKD